MIRADSVDPDEMANMSILIWIYTLCILFFTFFQSHFFAFFNICLTPLRNTMYSSILNHTSNAKWFRNVALTNIRGTAVIIVPFRGYGILSPNQVMIKRELLTDGSTFIFINKCFNF